MNASGSRYTGTAIFLHWSMAILICVLFGIGWYMVELPKGPARGETFALHKSLGLSAFMLLCWRLAWRLGHAPPAFPSEVSPWQARLARVVHGLFYALLIFQPLTGYLSSSFSGYQTSFFGWPLPHWGHADPPLNKFFTELHVAGSLALLSLLLLHLLGSAVHLLQPGQRMLRRMLPW